MAERNVELAEAYYRAFEAKDAEALGRRLHPEARVITPLGESVGREQVVEAAKRLFPALRRIDIRARFGDGDQVVLVFDMVGDPWTARTAALMTFKNGLLARSELFLDPRPFEKR
jgi:ketosteroid isomerase-like protein